MRVIIVVSLLLLTGCVTPTVIDGCRIFAPIAGSPTRDSPAIDQHNAKGVGACGWRAR